MRNEDGMTAFHMAAYAGNLQIVRFLEFKGAQINLKSITG